MAAPGNAGQAAAHGAGAKAHKIDREIDVLAAERDVLARERDSLKAALAKDPQQGSYAVLPYKGQNGTWRRPIVLECTNGTVTLRPKGPTFSMLDLSAMINPRTSPVVLAIARELLRVQMSESPDGAPVVPYFVFLVRPDGIRPYYEARARLEPLGIAFGYELIEQDLKVDVPDFDNLAAWDGTIPLEEPLMPAPQEHQARKPLNRVKVWAGPRLVRADRKSAADVRAISPAVLGEGEARATVKAKAEAGRRSTREAGLDGQSESPDAFVWPSAPASREPGRPASPNSAGRRPGNGLTQGQPIGSSSGETGEGQAGSATRRPGGLASASRRWAFPGQDLGGTGSGTDHPAATGESSSGSAYPGGPRGSAPARWHGRSFLGFRDANDSTPRARAGGARSRLAILGAGEARWPEFLRDEAGIGEERRPRRRHRRESGQWTGQEKPLLDRFEGQRRWLDRRGLGR